MTSIESGRDRRVCDDHPKQSESGRFISASLIPYIIICAENRCTPRVEQGFRFYRTIIHVNAV